MFFFLDPELTIGFVFCITYYCLLCCSLHLEVPIDENVNEAIRNVRLDSNSTNWMLATYQDKNCKKPLVIIASGENGVDELKKHLGNDMVAYGLVRVVDTIEGIKTIKFILIVWIGNDASIMTKAQITTHKGHIAESFAPCHCEVTVSDLSEISQDSVTRRIQAISGSKVL